MLTQQRILNVYDGLKANKLFLETHIENYTKANKIQPTEEIVTDYVNPLDKIKQVLALVETGLVYFESRWINPNGTVKKFSFWNPFSWKLMGESISYYAGLFSQIADVYTLDPQANSNLE